MKVKLLLCGVVGLLLLSGGCKKDEEEVNPVMSFRFAFAPNQARLDNFGESAFVLPGNAVQTPIYNQVAANFLELVPSAETPLGQGEVLYRAPTTTEGSAMAVNFNGLNLVEAGEKFASFPLNDLPPGVYEYLRVGIGYQNFEVDFAFNALDVTGVMANFLSYNTFITDHLVAEQNVTIDADRAQGFYMFETFAQVYQGQALATSVPNPLHATVLLPENSTILTAKFDPPIQVFPSNVDDLKVTLSLSSNLSFEWQDINADGRWQPDSEPIADMGIRGVETDWE